MVGLVIGIGIFVLIWAWIIYELYKTPLIDDNDNIIDFNEDEEFLC